MSATLSIFLIKWSLRFNEFSCFIIKVVSSWSITMSTR